MMLLTARVYSLCCIKDFGVKLPINTRNIEIDLEVSNSYHYKKKCTVLPLFCAKFAVSVKYFLTKTLTK